MSTFTVKIAKMNEVVYTGETSLISLPGLQGEISFTPHHSPYVVGLKKGDIKLYDQEKSTTKINRTFSIKSGHAHFYNNTCFVCIEIPTE